MRWSWLPCEGPVMSSSPTDSANISMTMPAINAAGGRATVVSWDRAPGERIADGEAICMVEAGGVRAAVESSASGVLTRIVADPGSVVASGAPLAEIAADELDQPGSEGLEKALFTSTGDPRGVDLATFRSPAVRRIMRDRDLDLSALPGSGRGGRVTREDVLAYLGERPSPPSSRS
jgi:pyruvate/2-oxoglutarate dehydrogenase complex dihydrolipoamide acyltransferase (E2) component